MAFRQLGQDQHGKRRTIADAIEVLRNQAAFADDDCATVRIGPLQLPSGKIIGMVQIVFDCRNRDQGFLVSLPAAKEFIGVVGVMEHAHFDIARLNGATVVSNGDLTLADGTCLRAVEVIPANLPLVPSTLDWRIVHHAIQIVGAKKRCYRRLKKGLPPPFQTKIPNLRFLDCNTLSRLKLPMFKIIADLIQAEFPQSKAPSQQHIADALRKFGIRVPKPRPRRKKASRVSALM